MATELQSLSKIFNNRIFRIPDYQRGYAWGERQLADFWYDLQRVSDERTHYCGQLTLEKAEKAAWRLWEGDTWLIRDAGYDPYFIVDGQQRLTTAIILLQCLLEPLSPTTQFAGLKVSELRERYLVKENGLLKSCLFGYAKDNPSHEFFRTQVLGMHSNEYRGVRTVYTNNLAHAKDYFRAQLAELTDPADRERVLKVLTQRILFNLHKLSDEIDVCVAFETMNNRGKPLSRLELLKNRLIYLSTLAEGSDSERANIRGNINAVWRTAYEELGKKPEKALDDDEFLRAHWVIFLGYDKDEPDPLTKILLNKHFTTERLDSGELTLADIQEYIDSLQISARVWNQIHFPEDNYAILGEKVAAGLIRLKRLRFGVLRPLLLAALCRRATSKLKPGVVPALLHQAERFLLLVRSFARKRSDVAEVESYRLAYAIHHKTEPISRASLMLRDRVSQKFSKTLFRMAINESFKDEGKKGFYDLPDIRFVLFEYEDYLRQKAGVAGTKVAWAQLRRMKNSVEHVYPQSPQPRKWPQFDYFPIEQRRYFAHNLGNLVAVSVAKNSSLGRRSFEDKKKGTSTHPGFNQDSFGEIEVAQYPEWTPATILDRGLKMLRFIEEHWGVDLGSVEEKTALLKLDFDFDAYSNRENTNVLLTRKGRVKLIGRVASVESLPVNEDDEAIALVPGSTVSHVVFLADNGMAYTMRMSDVPASSSYGEPITNFINIGEEARIIAAVTTDERFTPSDQATANGNVSGPYLLAAMANGRVLRTPLTPYRNSSTKEGRQYVRLEDDDKVVLACLLGNEETMFLVSVMGRLMHFLVRDVNIQSGTSKGVMGIKLATGDVCLGGQPLSKAVPTMTVETNNGKQMELGRGRFEVISRGGRGVEVVRRSSFVRVLPQPIQLTDWGEFETSNDE